MSDTIKCPSCGNTRPSSEVVCGICGKELYPTGKPTQVPKTEFTSSQPPPDGDSSRKDTGPRSERYATTKVIKYVRRPMWKWLAVGTDYFNMYFANEKLVVAKVHSGRWGLIGSIVMLPFYLILFIAGLFIGQWLDEKQGTKKCDQMENNYAQIAANPQMFKVKLYDYGTRVVLEKNDVCNPGKMKNKVSIEGEEYYFDDFEMDIAREKFFKYFEVIKSEN